MNKSQKKQLEILLEVDRICKKNNIKYFLSSGTLLGAVRHKGFIPWDDDIDIEMLREDFEMFKKVCKKELDKKYFYQDLYTDNNYGLIMAKVRINNTKYIEKMAVNNKAHNGIFIDIFPLDDFNNNKKSINKVIILRMLLLLKEKYTIEANTIIKKIELLILHILKMFCSKKTIIKRINKIINNSKQINSEYLVDYAETNFSKAIVPRKYYLKQKDFSFEGYKFPGTYYFDEYLTYMYGDYMKLPPKEKQIDHSVVEVEYND